MEAFLEYLLQNWALILVLLAFAILLRITVFLDRKTIARMYALVLSVFLLSIIVFIEFYLNEIQQYKEIRLVMMAIRYSATPLIIGLILYALVRKARWYVFIPAGLLVVFNIVSIFTGIVFSLNEAGELVRGPLGLLPYIGAGIYSVLLIVVLVLQSTRQITEIIPISFLAFSLASGIVLPFVFGKEYSRIFCTTIAVALFVYYVFSILQLTKKDALTGLLNRQAYYAFTRSNYRDITGFVSIDMNGLKVINDTQGHLAGDTALITLADCFRRATRNKQLVYRIGGDEFVIICRRTSEYELIQLVNTIKDNVSRTDYTVAIGYSYSSSFKEIDDMVKESDDMMYADKAKHYGESKNNRRVR